MRSDLVHEHLALAGLGHVDHLLNNIVGKLILHHNIQSTRGWDKEVMETQTGERYLGIFTGWE